MWVWKPQFQFSKDNSVSSPCPACRRVPWGQTCRRWPVCRLPGSSMYSWLCGADRLHERWWQSWSWARTSTGRWYLRSTAFRTAFNWFITTKAAWSNSTSDISKKQDSATVNMVQHVRVSNEVWVLNFVFLVLNKSSHMYLHSTKCVWFHHHYFNVCNVMFGMEEDIKSQIKNMKLSSWL